MTNAQKKILAKISKKENLNYWDEIDGEVMEFLLKLAKYSYSKVHRFYGDDEEDWYEDEDELEAGELTDEFWELICDVRDFSVNLLEKDYNAWFPYVDENY